MGGWAGWPLRWLAASVAGRFGGWPLWLLAASVAGRVGGWPLRWLAASASVAGCLCACAVLVLCLCTCRRLLVPLVCALVPVSRWYVGIGQSGGLAAHCCIM